MTCGKRSNSLGKHLVSTQVLPSDPRNDAPKRHKKHIGKMVSILEHTQTREKNDAFFSPGTFAILLTTLTAYLNNDTIKSCFDNLAQPVLRWI